MNSTDASSPDSPLMLEEHPEGVLLFLLAQPRAKRNGVVGIHAGRLKVAVTQAPEQGKANAALEKVLAKSLGLRKSQVNLHSGGTSREKTFLITGISLTELQQKLSAQLS